MASRCRCCKRRHGALAAALVTPIWVVWHLRYFFTVATYRNFPPAGYVGFVFGFVFGIACGSIVLTWLYNRTGGSILACAVWHGLFNLATGTAAATGTTQGVTSTFVYPQALLLVGLEVCARRRGEASILGPRRRDAPSSKGSCSAPRWVAAKASAGDHPRLAPGHCRPETTPSPTPNT